MFLKVTILRLYDIPLTACWVILLTSHWQLVTYLHLCIIDYQAYLTETVLSLIDELIYMF